jgi:hypothetical protein
MADTKKMVRHIARFMGEIFLLNQTTFFTGTSGFTCAMGFSPFIAKMRFFTAQVACRTTLS